MTAAHEGARTLLAWALIATGAWWLAHADGGWPAGLLIALGTALAGWNAWREVRR